MIPTEIHPDEALQRLKAGNERFITGNVREKHFQKEIEATSLFQDPHTIILTCADSRVAPEIIFDKSIGELFVIRVAGNVINPSILGSIEYAVKFLKASYLLIMGHTSCGAISAVINGGKFSPAIKSIVDKINPAYNKVKGMNLPEDEIINKTIIENVYQQIQFASNNSDILIEHLNSGKFKIGGAVYDIANGRVNFFD